MTPDKTSSLNFDNLNAQEAEFKKALDDAGIPTTSEALKAEFQSLADDEGVPFSNDSTFSPFWRLLKSVAATPVLWLLAYLVRYLMPQMFVKTATGAFLELLAWAFDITRKPAAKLTGTLTFTRASSSGVLLVPVGIWVRTVAINGTSYRVQVLSDTSFVEGETELQVTVEAELAGSGFNLAGGYFTILEVPIDGVTSVTNASDWITTPGADAESDDALRLRVRNQFSAVNQYHTDAVYRAMIAEQIGIDANRIYFDHSAPRGPGSADALVLFDTGVPSQAFLDATNSHITDNGNHGHGDDLQVIAMPDQDEDPSATLIYPNTLTSEAETALQADVEQFIRAAFRENSDYSPTLTWPFSRFSFSKLVQQLHAQFPDLRSVSFEQGDIITTQAVARLNSLTLNWTAEA
ncbi:MAG: baseplate J/gp47 family protein [Motiliproteus sp.]